MEVAKRIEQGGKFWFSTTELKGKMYFRISPVNFRTRMEHMDQLLLLLAQECNSVMQELDLKQVERLGLSSGYFRKKKKKKLGASGTAFLLRVQDQRLLQAEGERSFCGYADFFAAGEELGKRTSTGPCQRSNAGAPAAPKNSAHQSAETRASASKYCRAAVRPDRFCCPLLLMSYPPGIPRRQARWNRDPKSSQPN